MTILGPQGLAQDLANQVRHWEMYTAKIAELGLAPGLFEPIDGGVVQWSATKQL